MKCNKISYDSKTAAKEDVRNTNKELRYVHSVKLTPYKCPLCDKWHLTKLPKKVQKSRFGK